MATPNSPTLTVTTPSDREIVMTRVFDAPRHLVFDGWTKCEHLKRWWGPASWSLAVCEIDLRVGGSWRWVMRSTDGAEMGMHGEYREIVPPERLVSTEIFEEPFFEVMGAGTLNTMTLEEVDGKTTMILTTLYRSREARDAVMQTGFETGASESLDRLAELLQSLAA